MATLNRDEQAKVDWYEALERAQRTGTMPPDARQLQNARELAERAEANAEARERMQAHRQAEQDAQAAAHQARRDAEVLAAQEAYKRTARATFPGTAAQFEAAWPELLQAWQIRNTASDASALIEQKRRQIAEMF